MTDYNLTVSVNHEGIPPLLDVVQGDSGRNLVITVADMDITGYTARAYVVKPSGLDVYNNATVADGEIAVELTPQMLAEIGATKMQVSVYGADDERVTTFTIWLNVQESLQDNGQINSSTEYKTLDELIDNANTAIEDTTAATDEANKAAESANSAASSANGAASSATAAASNANTAADEANTATTAANNAAQSASDAAQAANEAATAITYPVPLTGGGTGADNYKDALANLHAAETTTEALTYYVDATSGSDDNDGLTEGTAFNTIQHAVDLLPINVAHFTVINLAEGTYDEDVIISRRIGGGSININGAISGTESNKLTNAANYKIRSISMKNNNLTTTVNGVNFTSYNGETGNNAAAHILNSKYASFNQCIFDGTSEHGIHIRTTTIYVNYCRITNKTYAVNALEASRVFVYIPVGSNNTVGINSTNGAIVQAYSAGSLGTTAYQKSSAGTIIIGDGTIQS